MSEFEAWLNSKALLAILKWPLLIGFVILSIAFILQWFFSLNLQREFIDSISYEWLIAASLIQLLVVLVMVFAWKTNLQLHGIGYVDISQSAVMIGLNSIGKYTPGKVLGIVARGSALYKITGDGRLVLQATLVEQVALLHSGGAITIVAWLVDKGHVLLAFILFPVILLSVVALSRSGQFLVTLVSRIIKKREMTSDIEHGFNRSYIAVFLLMTTIWGLSALALYSCLAAFDYRSIAEFWWLLWITGLAYMTGFLAFFAPAGLGAREGVILLMLSTQLDASVAVYVAILHRLITVLCDIVLGAYALLYGRNLLTTNDY